VQQILQVSDKERSSPARIVFCMKKLFYISLLYLTIFSTGFAEVNQFVFITGEQVVGVGVISGAITIQSQNSAGVSKVVSETTDLSFQSTSATGKFVAVSGKPTSKTMSKNTAKRSFYYIDNVPGKYTLTVKSTGRTSKKSFSLIQEIVVGNVVAPTEVKSIPTSSVVAPTVSSVPSTPVLVKPIIVPVKTEIPVKKKVEVIKQLPVKNLPEITSSTAGITEGVGLAAVIYTAPPKTSTLESFLWLPRKIWSTVKSIFQ